MPQTLNVAQKMYDDEGFPIMNTKTGKQKTTMKTVTVIRSWQSASGKQLFLHADGTYGYKDGSPVVSVAELQDVDLIGDPVHRELAMAWWVRKGEKQSKEFYSDLATKRRRVAESTPGVVRQVDSNLDTIMYRKRPLNDRRRAAFGEPFTWFTDPLFSKKRPDWWGFAEIIDINGCRYEMTDSKMAVAELEDKMEQERSEPLVVGGDHGQSLDDVMDNDLDDDEEE